MPRSVFAMSLCLWICLSANAFADGCTSDADCKAPRVCQSGACRDAIPRCATDRDCAGDDVCDQGQCTPPHPAPLPVAPPPMPPDSRAPSGPPDVSPYSRRPATMRHAGSSLAFEALLGGGFQDRDGYGSGLGWVTAGGVGIRFESGVALMALAGYASSSSSARLDDGTSVQLPRLHLAHLGAGVSLRFSRGSTTLGLAYASTPDTLKPDSGLAFLFRYFYMVSGRVGIVLDSAMAAVGDGRASTFSLGVGYAE